MLARMAYLMHVDWNWIKQRPHFIAEKLVDYYEIDLFYIHKMYDKSLIENSISLQFNNVHAIKKIPLSGRVKSLQITEKLLNKYNLKRIYNGDFDVIWITSPVMLQFINIELLTSHIIIYDCMDDVTAFPQSNRVLNYVEQLEKKLISRADIIITSSYNLSIKMRERGAKQDIHVINNAIDINSVKSDEKKSTKFKHQRKMFSIIYFGTIGSWIDFKKLTEIVIKFDDVEILLYGPKEVSIPSHPRIKYQGIVKHEDLYEISKDADAFIMPFIVNDLVLSVDPVKVYEYISFNKPTIVVDYPETTKFNEFVYLYSNSDELIDIINMIKESNNPKRTEEEINMFISRNNWGSRGSEIESVLRKYINGSG